MDKLRHRSVSDGDLAAWEAELGQRLASLNDLPTPPSFAPEATEQFLQQLRVQPAQQPAAARRPAPIMRLGMRFAAALVACLLGVSGVGYATATSLPGDPLYTLKRQVETVQLAVSPMEQQPEFTETLMDRRLDEVEQLVEQHASEARVEAGVAEYAAATVAFGHAPATSGKEALFQRHLDVLTKLESAAPAQNRTALRAAQRAAQAQIGNSEHAAPQPTMEMPRVIPSQTPVKATPTMRPSATTAPVVPMVSRPTVEDPTEQIARPSAIPPTATAEVPPSATPPATTEPQQEPKRESPAATSAASAKPARRPSLQPTHAPTLEPPSDAPSATRQPDDAHEQPPAPTSEQPGDPREPAAPSPRSEQPDEDLDQPNQPPSQRNPPSDPRPEKTQAPESKPGSGGSQQPPSGSGDTHPRRP